MKKLLNNWILINPKENGLSGHLNSLDLETDE